MCRTFCTCGDSTKSFNNTNLMHHIKTKHSEEIGQFLEMKKRKESEGEGMERSQVKSISGLHQATLQRRENQTTHETNDPIACAIHKK